MSTTLYYFSGSGNSLFTAREMQKRIPGSNLIPMVSLLSQERIIAQAETVGLVFPVHCTTIPVPVREFLTKLDLRPSKYVFAVSTQERRQRHKMGDAREPEKETFGTDGCSLGRPLKSKIGWMNSRRPTLKISQYCARLEIEQTAKL